jgi:hypothetical protein
MFRMANVGEDVERRGEKVFRPTTFLQYFQNIGKIL